MSLAPIGTENTTSSTSTTKKSQKLTNDNTPKCEKCSISEISQVPGIAHLHPVTGWTVTPSNNLLYGSIPLNTKDAVGLYFALRDSYEVIH
jgi:hypothetical protein